MISGLECDNARFGRVLTDYSWSTGNYNSFLVKQRTGTFSRDALNLTNQHSRKVWRRNLDLGVQGLC